MAPPTPGECLHNETLLNIFEHINVGTIDHNDWHASKSNLNKISQSCQHFNKLIEPLMYEGFYQSSRSNGGVQLALFLRTILQRTDLCAHVKALAFNQNGNRNDRLFRFLSREKKLKDSILQSAASFLVVGQQEQSEWATALDYGHESAVQALLFSHTPNITHLILRDCMRTEFLVQTIMRRPISPDASRMAAMPCFNNLEHVEVTYSEHFRDRHDLLSHILQLPSAETLSIKEDTLLLRAMPDKGLNCPATSSTIHTLRIFTASTEVSATGLETFLRSFHALRHLEWTTHFSDHVYQIVEWPVIHTALRHQHNSLELLSLRHRRRNVGSLDRFVALKQASFPQVALWGSMYQQGPGRMHALPPNIEVLEIDECDSSFFPFMQALLPLIESHYPSLRTIRTDSFCRGIDSSLTNPMVLELKRLFRALSTKWMVSEYDLAKRLTETERCRIISCYDDLRLFPDWSLMHAYLLEEESEEHEDDSTAGSSSLQPSSTAAGGDEESQQQQQ